MNSQQLDPSFKVLFRDKGIKEISELAKEPSLFSCSIEHAYAKGGDITKDVLDKVTAILEKDIRSGYGAGLYEIVDVRVQRLMPGMFPSIPGWHCDSVPRKNYFSQPDFKLLNKNSFHVTCIFDSCGEVSNTAFLGEPILFNFDDQKPVWQQLHRQIESAPRRVRHISPGELVKFDSLTPHKTSPCIKRGWRYFFRMSMYHNPPISNGVPAQQQVYVLSEENGW